MTTLWFWTLAAMFTAYAVLDGYDLGVGVAHLGLARNRGERARLLAAIGPVWNANEVWLLAAGGMMVMAFPRLYAAAFSGFYLALILVLWLLVLRGVSIEVRGQFAHPMWNDFWDAVFSLASLLLALLLGVALGNVVRGLPIGANGFFQGSFAVLLNPYAVLIGLLSVVVLSWHGVNFLRGKTEGELQARLGRAAAAGWWLVAAAIAAATAATFATGVDPLLRLRRLPAGAMFPLLVVAGLILSRRAPRAFTGSSLVIVGLMGTAATTLFPRLLPSTLDPAFSLTTANAATSAYGLRVAWIGNALALTAVAAYRFYIHRVFRGPAAGGYEHD